jgi:hypothetical protein
MYRLKFRNLSNNREGELSFQTEIAALTFVRDGIMLEPISLTHPNGVVVDGKDIAALVRGMR